MRTKAIFLLLLVLLLALLILAKEKLLLYRIIYLSEIDQRLGQQLSQNLRLQVAKTQTLTGGNEKYLLEDRNGQNWLFKTYKEPLGVKKDVCFSQLAQICGVNTSICSELILPVNEELVHGSLQKLFPQLEEIPKRPNVSQAQQLLNAHIFKWLSGGDEVEVFLYNNQLVLLDIGETLEEDSKDMLFIFEDIFMPFIKNKSIQKQRYEEVVIFINFLQQISDKAYCAILQPILDLVPEQKAIFLRRKNNLLFEYDKFYNQNIDSRPLKKHKGVPLKFYANIIKKLEKSIETKKQSLADRPSPLPAQQPNFIITSKRCRFAAADVASLKNEVFSKHTILERDRDVKMLIERFKHFRKEEMTMHEKLAICLYITQFNSDIPGFVPPLKRSTFHPEELKQDCLEANLRVSSVEASHFSQSKGFAFSNDFIAALNQLRDRDIKNPVELLKSDQNYFSLLLLGRVYETGDKYFRFYSGLRIDQAIAAYNGALKENINSVSSYVNLFQLYLLKQDLSNALSILKEIVLLFPEIKSIWNLDLEMIDEIVNFSKQEGIEKIENDDFR
ncbi:tetratricopeptide repeat protein [Candidatus Omnitrophota bacterium]